MNHDNFKTEGKKICLYFGNIAILRDSIMETRRFLQLTEGLEICKDLNKDIKIVKRVESKSKTNKRIAPSTSCISNQPEE